MSNLMRFDMCFDGRNLTEKHITVEPLNTALNETTI